MFASFDFCAPENLRSMKSSVASLGVTLLGILLLGVKISSLQAIFVFCAGFLLFSLPGVALGPALFGDKWLRQPEMFIFCPPLGIALSGSVAVAIGYLIRWSPLLILPGIGFLTVVCVLASIALRSRPLFHSPRTWAQWEYVLLAAITAALGIFVAIPFLNFGQTTSHGYAYTWLFGYDFLVRGEYTLAMTMGFPPTCLPLAGEPLHMYLVGYALPAFVYSAAGKTIALHQTLLLTSLFLDIFFYAGLFAFLRSFAEEKRHLFSLAVIYVFGYSYYWLVPAAKFLVSHASLPGTLTALGGTLDQFGNVSHLFTPLVLVEPQAVLATCLLLFLLIKLESSDYEIENHPLALMYGITLGITFGVDALWGLTVMLWVGVVGLLRLISDRARIWKKLRLLTLLVLAAGVTSGCFFLIGMYQLKSGQEMFINPYGWFFEFAPVYLLVEFGPLVIVGAWGFLREWRVNRSGISIGVIVLGVLGLLETAFLQVAVLPRTRMATRLFPIVFLVGIAYFCRRSERQVGSCWGHRLALPVVLLAVPTFFTDVYFASNVNDDNETRYVRVADRQACDWIRSSLPESAVIQGEAEYKGSPTGYNPRQQLFISLIADFGERKQALGWNYVAGELVPHGAEVVSKRAIDLQNMLSASEGETILKIAGQYKIGYIYVGPYERALHPKLLSTLASSPRLFNPVYSAAGVSIFQVLNSGS